MYKFILLVSLAALCFGANFVQDHENEQCFPPGFPAGTRCCLSRYDFCQEVLPEYPSCDQCCGGRGTAGGCTCEPAKPVICVCGVM